MLIPSEDHPHALSYLQTAIGDDVSIRVAVAFVTTGGLSLLADLLAERQNVSLEVIARAADATEPNALLGLRDRLGAEVSVVIGQHARTFHPKLWLLESAEQLVVLSGSGNLTHGGLVGNDEQFEVLRYAQEDAAVAAHRERLEVLTRNAQPLAAVVDSAMWRDWVRLRRERERLSRRIDEEERRLLDREFRRSRSDDEARVIADLQQIYEDTVTADLPQRDGRQYHPSRLLTAINRARRGEREPVMMVAEVIRRKSGGLNILLAAGRVDLTLEWLVLDETKPYNDLFKATSTTLSRERVEEFRAAGHPVPEQPGVSLEPPRAMSTEQLRQHLEGLMEKHPGGMPLPVLHHSHATLLRLDGADHVVVRRDSGELARIPLRLVRLRLDQMAGGQRFQVSQLNFRDSDRFSAALGPLLAALPGVTFNEQDQRLHYVGVSQRAW